MHKISFIANFSNCIGGRGGSNLEDSLQRLYFDETIFTLNLFI